MSSALDPSDRALSVSAGESSRLRRRPAVVLRTPASGPVSIFCGSQDAINSQNISEYDYDEHRPWSVQILPEEEGPPPPTREFRSSRSNGCGAEVHSSVCMMRRNQCWYGSKEDLSANVIPLERSYFPTDLAQLLDLRHDEPAACGCALSGLGCAVCGNPLGVAQYVCATHSSRGTSMAGPTGYIFAASAVSASEAPPTAHQNSEVPTGSSLPTWNTQIPHNGDILAASRSLPSPPTPTTPGMRFPSSPPGYVSFIPPSTPPSFIPPTTPTSASTTSFVPPTTTSFVPPTTIPTSPGAGAGTTTGTAPGDLPPRPRRRRTLRTPESVEQYFGGDPSVSVGAGGGGGGGGGGGARFASTGTGTVASPASISSLPFIPSASLPLPLSLSPTSSSPSSAMPPTPTSAGGVSSSSFPADLQRNMVQLFGRETSPMPSPGLPVWGYESGSGSPGANSNGNTNSGNTGNSNNGGTAATETRPSPGANPSTNPRTVTDADAAALRWGSWRPYPWDDAVRWVASQGGGGGGETTTATRDTVNGNISNEEMPPLDPDTAPLPPPLTTRSGNMLFPSPRDNSNTLPPPTNPTTNTNRNSLPSIRDLALSFDRSFPPPPPPPPHPHQHHHHHYPPHPPHPHAHAHHHHHHHAHSPLPTTFAPPPAPGLPLPQPQSYAHPPPPVHPHPHSHAPALPTHWPTHPLPPGATNARVREIVEQHLDVLGVRAAALDAAAANVRQHIEALRMDAAARAAGAGSSVNANAATTTASTASTATTTSTPSSPPAPAPSLEGQEAAVAAATRAGLLREARADLRAAMATRRNTYTAGFGAETLQSNQANPLLPPGSALRAEPPTTAAALRETIAARENQAREMRLMIAEERARLSELQARLYEEGGPSASSLPSSSASSTSTLVPSASSSSTTLVNPATTATTTSRSPTEQPSIADIRAIVRQQTALLSRVSNLISDVGTQMGELEGNRAAATMLARVRETVDRHAGTIRSASGVLAGMVDNNNNNVDIQSALWRSERLAALGAVSTPGAPSSAVADMDAVRTMEANAQRFLADAQRAAAALGAGVEVSSSPSADAGNGTPAQGEEDKQPAPPRRRTFFER